MLNLLFKSHNVMEEIGVVYKVSKSNFATVRFDRRTACENCNMCLKPREQNYVELKIKNTINAKEGDKVKVMMSNKAVITASLLVYIVPLIIFGIALFASSKLKLWLSLLISFLSLVLSFIMIFIIDKIIRNKSNFTPKMIEIIRDLD
ncbi:MAG TPA: SoxR reducing system RseC family protein [Clostridiales bacterium]|nr:SoxR reducing system RseC family protein [Clostridiales bacterium]